jgi:hypothetical protein
MILQETWASRRVDIDPVARIVRVFAPSAMGLPTTIATVAFDAIVRIDADELGCVRIVCRDRTVDVVDIMHPCTLEGARKTAERICEIVFGESLPLPPQPMTKVAKPTTRTVRVEAASTPEDREIAKAPRRREGWDP